MNQLISYVSGYLPHALTPYSFIVSYGLVLLLILTVILLCKRLFRRHSKDTEEIDRKQLMRYAEVQSADELPDDRDFVRLLLQHWENDGDDQRAFLCRKKLVKNFHQQEHYYAYALDLIDGRYCKKDIASAIYYLKLEDSDRAHYRLYTLYADTDQREYNVSQAAMHLATAAQMDSTEASDAVQSLYKEAECGSGKAAFLLSMYIGRMQTTLFSEKERFRKNIEMLFWMLIAKELGFPEGVEYYEDLDVDHTFPAQSEEALAIAKKALREKDRPTYIVHIMLAVIYGNPEALRTLGRVLQLSKPPLHNNQLGELCLYIAERNKANT